MFWNIARQLAHQHDPRPALVARALGMDVAGWPADPATHLGMAQRLLQANPAAFAALMSRLDQLELGIPTPQGKGPIKLLEALLWEVTLRGKRLIGPPRASSLRIPL